MIVPRGTSLVVAFFLYAAIVITVDSVWLMVAAPAPSVLSLLEACASGMPADGSVVMVCHSGSRSALTSQQRIAAPALADPLMQQGHPHPRTDREGGSPAWQRAGLPVRQLKSAPMPLKRQEQIDSGSLVLLGVILSQVAAPGWIWLSSFCGMARLLAALPCNWVML